MRKFKKGDFVVLKHHKEEVFEVTNQVQEGVYEIRSTLNGESGMVLEAAIEHFKGDPDASIVVIQDYPENTLVRIIGEKGVYKVIGCYMTTYRSKREGNTSVVAYKVERLTNGEILTIEQEKLKFLASAEQSVGYVNQNKKEVLAMMEADKMAKINHLLDLYNTLELLYDITQDEYYKNGMEETMKALHDKNFDFQFDLRVVLPEGE